ncbi:MAG: sodium/hydrogen exchanger [Burkholderiales bacterium]|jgi:cell volume regulation protein A|nr:sodium/hydrogen exchanger [Burkholderiales bacterium]
MEAVNTALLLGALLLFVSIAASVISSRLGFPLLLVFLVVGMLAGEDGPGGVHFDDFETSFLIGNLALAVILLDGGLRTNIRTFRVALGPALALATLGVVLTAATLGAFAAMALGFGWKYGMLFGAIVGSTDAAAVFSLLRHSGVTLNERVSATLEIESGSNDPMAIFLTIVLVELIGASTPPGGFSAALLLAQQLGIGALGGVIFGFALREAVHRIRLPEGLYALFIVSGAIASFSVINKLGGSGFLGIYIMGLIVGNGRSHATEHVMRVMDGLAWLAQAGMFVLLGLLVTPSAVARELGPALAAGAFLILVARPVATFLTLIPFRFNLRENFYVAWMGLRGAVPIILALFPLMAGLDGSMRLFQYTFVVVLLSLLIQGTTVAPIARLLRLEVPAPREPRVRSSLHLPTGTEYELLEFVVEPQSAADGANPSQLPLPPGARLVAAARGKDLLIPPPALLQAGDIGCVLAPEDSQVRVGELFAAGPGPAGETTRRFFGDFVLNADALVEDVCAAYGVPPVGSGRLDEFLRRRLKGRPVVGDAVEVGDIELTVREMDGPRIVRVGLKLR